MIYYRIAFRGENSPAWQWKSTTLTSLNSVFAFLNAYSTFPWHRTFVFFVSEKSFLNHMLARKNAGLIASSIAADCLMRGEQRIDRQEMVRLEREFLIQEHLHIPASVAVRRVIPVASGSLSPAVSPPGQSGLSVDHDPPYSFAPPDSWQQARIWLTLLARVRRGELQP